MIRQLALLVVLASGACQPTGIHLTVRGPSFNIDQLEVTATFNGKVVTHRAPATPAPLSLPTDLFAAFDAQTADVDLLVDAYHGNRVARGRAAGVHVTPHQVTEAYVDLYGVVADSAYTREVLSDSPIAYYRLDDVEGTTVIDSSGNGVHGEYGMNVEHLAAGLTGDGDAAAAFAGGPFSLKAMIIVPPNAMLQPSGAVSVELWLQPSAPPNDHDTALVEYGDGPVALSAAYGVRLQGGVLGGLLATSQSQTSVIDFRGMTAPATNVRYHCVETYDGTWLRLYVDGLLQATKAATGTLYYSIGQAGLGIGGYGDGDVQDGDVIFAGTIDDVAIYGSALTPDRIAAHHNAATQP
jgi:hypothetical protein